MGTTSVKDEVRKIAERLPDEATWDDVLYEIQFRQKVDAGLKESEEGRGIPQEEVMRMFGLEP